MYRLLWLMNLIVFIEQEKMMITKNQTKIKAVLTLAAVTLAALAIGQVQAQTIYVPNNSFELIYKPGSTTITADLGGNWTNGVGPDTPMQAGQLAVFSDGTTGAVVDIPGWINAPGWPPSYDLPKGCGSVAGQTTPPDGDYYYLANGGDWGNPQGGAIESDAPLGTVNKGTYTLSMLVNSNVTVAPVVLELLANGVPLTPSSTIDPGSYSWTEVSKTYDEASLAGHLCELLTIRVGFGPEATGEQGHIDLVTLEFESADPNAPDVDAGNDWITWSGQPVTLDPTVVEKVPTDWINLTYAWTADPDTGVVITEDGINPDDPATKEATVTITKATDNPSTVNLTLSVYGQDKPTPVCDTTRIFVYDDACLAGKAAGTLVYDPGDFDGNCITDLKDYAALAATWLVEYALTAPEPKPL